MKEINRKCPKCGGKGRLVICGGTTITHYCECAECNIRTYDYKSATAAIHSWNTDSNAYFFLQERIKGV